MKACFGMGRIGRLLLLVLLTFVSQSGLLLRAQQLPPQNPLPDAVPVVTDANGKTHLARTPEDFSAITLQGSQLEPIPPVRGSHIVKEKFTEDILQVGWRNFDAIDLYVAKPAGVAKPPVIIYLYGYPSNMKVFSEERWLERVTSGGYAAVGFVGALTDYRFRMRPMKQSFMTELGESLATTTHDVQMVLNYLETRKDLDMSNVGIFGTGSGATVAILAAAADPRIKAIECLEPWGDWPKWVAMTNNIMPQDRADYMKPEFLAKVAPMDPVKWLPALTNTKVQIQFIDTDDERAKASRVDIEAAAPKTAEVRHFENRGQHFGAVSNGRLFDWIKAQLQAPASPQPANQTRASAQDKLSQAKP